VRAGSHIEVETSSVVSNERSWDAGVGGLMFAETRSLTVDEDRARGRERQCAIVTALDSRWDSCL
jgi:hypothetical protein